MTLAEFRRVYPTATFTVSSGKLFTYRYYQNPQAKATLVLLTGGIGLSDLFYKHFARFARAPKNWISLPVCVADTQQQML